MTNNIAIVVPGLLREIDGAKKWFQSLPPYVDIFVVTSKDYSNSVKKLGRVKQSIIIEDEFYFSREQKELLKYPEGSKLLQWQKFWLSMGLVETYSQEQNINYLAIFKLRTDIDFNEFPIIDIDFVKNNISDSTVVMHSDIVFGSTYKRMLELSKFFYASMLKFYDRPNVYHPIDYNMLIESDMGAGKFKWLQYPRDIFSSCINMEEILIKINKLKDCIQSFSFERNTKVFNFKHNNENIKYPSESSFLTYVLGLGLSAKVLKGVRLKESRHNAIDFRENYDIDAFLKEVKVRLNQPVKLKNFAIEFEKSSNITMALKVMTLALNANPSSKVIKAKVEYYTKLLNKSEP